MDAFRDGDMRSSLREIGGEVARLMVERDWSDSPLGSPESWSPTLKSTVRTLLRAGTQIVMFWGPELVALYNDAYAPGIGDKHPRALGSPARENWAELWDDLGPLLNGVLHTGKTFFSRDRPFYIERHGYGEATFWDVSYSAVIESDGSVGGVLYIVTETT
ncbi:MAG: histidine kinase, partial [Acidisphaera sp.]|nr:histidine kinase [Acidisphaera sp.]